MSDHQMVKGNFGENVSFLAQWEAKKYHKAQNQRRAEQALLFRNPPFLLNAKYSPLGVNSVRNIKPPARPGIS